MAKDFHVLGTSGVPCYLYDSERPVLFDAGLTCLGKLYIEDAQEVLGQRSPEYLFLTHAHFDHVGAVSVLKKRYPEMRIAASAVAARILKKPRAIELIRSLNEAAKNTVRSEAKRRGQMGDFLECSFEPFQVDVVLQDGERVELGDSSSVLAMKTPGHTRDFFTYYLPERKILVSSEAAGCTDPSGFIYTEFLVSFDDYLASMEKLRALPVELLCQGHYSVLTGKDAVDFFVKSARTAVEYKEMVEDFLTRENGEVSKVVERVREREWDPRPEPKQPLSAYLLNTGARVEHIKKLMSRD